MPTTKIIELEELLPDVVHQYYRLVLIVGPIGSGKTPLLKELCRRQDIPYLNVNLALSERLLSLTSKERRTLQNASRRLQQKHRNAQSE